MINFKEVIFMNEKILNNPEEYLPLVKNIVDRFDIRLPAHWDREDMIGYGVLGLLEAMQRFQPEKGVKFTTFATKRIRGAILDALRKDTPLSRSCWKRVRKITAAIDKIAIETGNEATIDEIAREIGLDIGTVEDALESLKMLSHISLDKTLGFTGNEEIKVGDKIRSDDLTEESILQKERVEILAKAIAELGERQRLILTLYYYEELTLKEIAHITNISVSRVSQIKSLGLAQLRNKIMKEELV